MRPAFPELGFYALPGHVSQPGELVDDVRQGEALGLGSVWISERLNTKNVEVLSGLAAAHTSTMGIASGLIANLPLRNPLVTASYASTMALLTHDRFALAMGRGQDSLSDAAGVPRLNFQILEDSIRILRSLWRGEAVTYSGPVGNFHGLSLGMKLDVPPPIVMAVMGDKTSYWAGQHCDAVVYNSLWSPRAIEASTKLVRQGARDAGRDPASVRVWAICITACELSDEDMLPIVVRRMNTYLAFKGMWDVLCKANGWDLAALGKVRALQAEIDGRAKGGTLGDENTSRKLDDIRRSYEAYPRHWIDEGCAVGSAAYCAAKVRERFDAGADGVLLHGSTPRHLASLLAEWPKHRSAGRFDGLHVNPGL